MIDKFVLHELEEEKAQDTEPFLFGDYKLYYPKPEDIILENKSIVIKRILRPWYEMLDLRK